MTEGEQQAVLEALQALDARQNRSAQSLSASSGNNETSQASASTSNFKTSLIDLPALEKVLRETDLSLFIERLSGLNEKSDDENRDLIIAWAKAIASNDDGAERRAFDAIIDSINECQNKKSETLNEAGLSGREADRLYATLYTITHDALQRLGSRGLARKGERPVYVTKCDRVQSARQWAIKEINSYYDTLIKDIKDNPKAVKAYNQARATSIEIVKGIDEGINNEKIRKTRERWWEEYKRVYDYGRTFDVNRPYDKALYETERDPAQSLMQILTADPIVYEYEATAREELPSQSSLDKEDHYQLARIREGIVRARNTKIALLKDNKLDEAKLQTKIIEVLNKAVGSCKMVIRSKRESASEEQVQAYQEAVEASETQADLVEQERYEYEEAEIHGKIADILSQIGNRIRILRKHLGQVDPLDPEIIALNDRLAALKKELVEKCPPEGGYILK